MPNFIPKIEFITVADWFRTSEVGDGQKSDLERASILGRKLVAAENAINQAKIEGQYRPEEYQIAMDRIKQLKDMMPTQRLVVRVPFSGDHNDSRIFCSQGLQLRPSLLGWHGKPPVSGEESTIFLEGRNFSVHDTHVIAGGKLAAAVLVTRNVLEVTIAKDAAPTPSSQRKRPPRHQRRHAQRRLEPPSDPDVPRRSFMASPTAKRPKYARPRQAGPPESLD